MHALQQKQNQATIQPNQSANRLTPTDTSSGWKVLSPPMQKSLAELQNSFPVLKEIDGLEVDDEDDSMKGQAIRVSLLKTAAEDRVHTLATVEFDEKGEVSYLQIQESENGAKPAIPIETAKERAAAFLEKMIGADASAFDIVSVWTEKSYDMQMNGTIRKYTVNFKAPVPADSTSAFYATLLLDRDGEFLSFEKGKKPVS